MISISGIEYQEELEKLPFFNKNTACILIGKQGKNLDKKIAQLGRIGYLKTIKKGMYVSTGYVDKELGESYMQFMANVLRSPSYISAEYVLAREGLIPESVYWITSITIKSSRKYSNFLGNYLYRNIKNSLFLGFKEKNWNNTIIYTASKAKALFDYFYLKSTYNIRADVYDARINWDNFSEDDLLELVKYVKLSKSIKMNNILNVIKKYYVS